MNIKLFFSISILLFGLTALFNSTAAQRPDPTRPEGGEMAVPERWVVRLDRPDPTVTIGANPDSADIFFVNMVPGWHITTGPAGIFYHPESTARQSYRASVKVHLFDPNGRKEGYGLFFGGQDLQGPDQRYTYFLLRNSGEFLVKVRQGDETEVIKTWTAHSAIKTYGPSSGSSVANTLEVDVRSDSVHFLVNGTPVYSHGAGMPGTDGIVGLRINHALNVHVEDLSVQGQ